DIDQRVHQGKTALMAAAAAGDVKLLERLIDAGADPKSSNDKGASVLIYAAWRGDPEVVSALIARGVDLEKKASNGWTAVTMAAAKGHNEAIRLLLAAGARVDSPDVYGWTPLMRATDLGRTGAVTVLVREGKARIGAMNAAGQTALHVAAAGGRGDLYRLLVHLGADPEHEDARGTTAAEIARRRGIEAP
ncbi:MAG: ankyrin repeat domain-containing protein, partial [Burkholderiales bacterium]